MNVDKIYRKILELLRANKSENLMIERSYLPEILEEGAWRIDDQDILPKFSPDVKAELKIRGIDIKYDKNILLIYKKSQPDFNYSI